MHPVRCPLRPVLCILHTVPCGGLGATPPGAAGENTDGRNGDRGAGGVALLGPVSDRARRGSQALKSQAERAKPLRGWR